MGIDFRSGNTIFVDEDVLRDDYTPDELIERDDELSTYQAALQPIVNGSRPRNIFLYGQTGVGKSLSTKMIMDELRDYLTDVDGVSLRVIGTNCKESTSYQVMIQLLNEISPESEEISFTGYPADEVQSRLWDKFSEIEESTLLVVLDEVDSLGTDDNLLYHIPRCNDNGNVDPDVTKVGVVGVCNDFTFRDNLSARVRDSLCDHQVHFPPYDAQQLCNILEQRAEEAFVDEVLSDGVIPLAAGIAGQETGSARHALQLLYHAGHLARDDSETETVTEEHVREATRLYEQGRVRDELANLPQLGHVVLCSLLRAHDTDKTPIRRKPLYQIYTEAAETIGADVKTNRTVLKCLNQLVLKGFANKTKRNEGMSGGKYHLYDLGVQTEVLREVLSERPRVSPLVEL